MAKYLNTNNIRIHIQSRKHRMMIWNVTFNILESLPLQKIYGCLRHFEYVFVFVIFYLSLYLYFYLSLCMSLSCHHRRHCPLYGNISYEGSGRILGCFLRLLRWFWFLERTKAMKEVLADLKITKKSIDIKLCWWVCRRAKSES